jgi:hypothetical protein
VLIVHNRPQQATTAHRWLSQRHLAACQEAARNEEARTMSPQLCQVCCTERIWLPESLALGCCAECRVLLPQRLPANVVERRRAIVDERLRQLDIEAELVRE